MEQNTGLSQSRTVALKTLSIVGFVAVLIFGVWGLIQVARLVPNAFSSIQSAAVSLSSIFVPAERLEISIPSANVNSGEVFTFSWVHTNKSGDGTYRISFDCRDGVSMQTPDQNGIYQKVFCDTPFNLTNSKDSVKLIAFSDNNRYVDVPMKLAYTRLSDGKVTASTETTITITNDKLSSGALSGTTTPAATTPAPVKVAKPNSGRVIPIAGTPARNVYTITTSGRSSDPNGRVDLEVTILGEGFIDPATNTFVQSPSIRRGGRGAVRFEVSNIGTKTSENWTFNAVVPTFPMYIYSSDMQPNLAPGDKIEYTLGFDQADPVATHGIVTINVDPSGSMNEITKNNNIARATFNIFE